jgi:hypothetical protein
MKVNPKVIAWSAPTTNTDGTQIAYALEYEVGQVLVGGIVPIMVVASQLQEGGQYNAPIADIALDFGEHTLVLRTFAKEDQERKSEWSVGVTFALSAQIPNPPFDVSAY